MKHSPLARILCASAAIGAPLLLTLAGRADDKPILSLSDVLARCRQATDLPPANAAAKTRRTTGTTNYGGLHGTYVIIEQFPDKHWEHSTLGIYDETSGTDGKVSWQRDSNGNVRLQSASERRDDRTNEVVNKQEYADADEFAGKVALRPQTERKTGAYVLDVAPTGGVPTTLYLDPKTFLVIKKESMEDSRLKTTTYSDFQVLDGRLRAATRRTHVGDRKYDSVTTISAMVDNVDAPDTLFALPATASNYKWVKPGATSAIIPFDYSDESVALYCAINGRPVYLELDSGAGGVAVAKYAADVLKLPHTGTFEAIGYGGSIDEYLVTLDSFEIVDGVVFSKLTATSLPLFDDYSTYQAVPVMGLVGYDLLSRFVVRVDYANQELTLIDPASFKPTAADGTALPLDLDGNVPSVLASFDGLPPARFLVDTGDGVSTVALYSPYVAANKLTQKYPKGVDAGGEGVGGETHSRRVRGHSFAIGGLTLASVPTDLSLDTQGAGVSHTLAGALGTDFLSHFTVVFDYPHSRLFFSANDNTKKPFDTRSFGVYVVSEPDENSAHKTVMRLYADDKAPALDAGLRQRSTLLKIDGQDAQVLGLGEVRRLLSVAGGKDTRDLTIIGPDGGTGRVTVKLYDPIP